MDCKPDRRWSEEKTIPLYSGSQNYENSSQKRFALIQLWLVSSIHSIGTASVMLMDDCLLIYV
jgi:hypothetical protein